MKARLGFAGATTVQPEILVVDEVLSVGDKDFQTKCQRRMEHMLQSGVTLLFVSHNEAVVKKLCKKALWLDRGQAAADGECEAVCRAYRERAR